MRTETENIGDPAPTGGKSKVYRDLTEETCDVLSPLDAEAVGMAMFEARKRPAMMEYYEKPTEELRREWHEGANSQDVLEEIRR